MDAILDEMPPEDGAEVELAGARGARAVVKAAVTPVNSGGRLGRWNIALVIPRNSAGTPLTQSGFYLNESLLVSWSRAQISYSGAGGSSVTAIIPTFNYLFELLGRGKFKRDIAGSEFYGLKDGKEYYAVIGGTSYITETTLAAVKNPNMYIYRVDTDENMGLLPTYWQWYDGKWNDYILQTYPAKDAQIERLQYAYTGKFLICVGEGITPFTLNVTDDIKLGEVGVTSAVTVEKTADRDFGLVQQNSILDEAVPVYFMRSAAFSPSVVAYINGRLWMSGLPDEPSRIYVSKPQEDKEEARFDFSTYKIRAAVTPVFHPFQARNDIGSNILSGLDSGALGLMMIYAQTTLKKKKVDFGFDMPFIVATPYFSEGARTVSLSREVEVAKTSKALPNEYTERAAADLRIKAGFNYGVARTRVTLPGAGCLVTCDCEGFEVRIVNWHLMIGISTSTGPIAKPELACGWTAWNKPGPERVGVIAGAVAAAAIAAFGINSALVAASLGAVLAAASGVTDALLNSLVGDLKLSLTDGSTYNPSLGELAIDWPIPDSIRAKCDYMLAKNRLYETKQPFVMRTWDVEETEISTPECGFTFKPSSDAGESLSFITDLRSIFFSTESGERVMPSNVDGAS
jgi:hypothetical protein